MKRSSILGGALAVALAAGLSACGGAPSKDDLVESIEKQDVPPGSAACIADELLDSDLSEQQLTAIADDDQEGLSDKEVEEVTEVVLAAIGSCGSL